MRHNEQFGNRGFRDYAGDHPRRMHFPQPAAYPGAGFGTAASLGELYIAVSYLDHAAQQAITDWQQQHHATGGKVHIDGVLEHGHSTRMLQW